MASISAALAPFHPHTRAWFESTFSRPTDVQTRSWPVIAAGRHALITAPTGSGKTLTAFLWALDAFASGRYGVWELRGGPVRTFAYGDDNLRTRLAVAIHYAGYAVGLAREGSPNGLGPNYQFVLSSVIR